MSNWWEEPIECNPDELEDDDDYIEGGESDDYVPTWTVVGGVGDWVPDVLTAEEGRVDPETFTPIDAPDVQAVESPEQSSEGDVVLDDGDDDDGEAAPPMAYCDVQRGGESIDGEAVSARDVLTYAITYAPPASGTFVVTDEVPEQVTVSSITGGGSAQDGVITWSVTGSSISVGFTASVNDGAEGVVSNRAIIDDGDDAVSSNTTSNEVDNAD